MARKRSNGATPTRQTVRRRRIRSGPVRALHITLPLEVAKRLERIALERDTIPSVVVCDLVERCPIRPGGDGPAEPAGDG